MSDLENIADSYAFELGNTKDAVIKEILHYDILQSLSQSDIVNDIVFQGGTSLRLCYGNNRHSEDLNFVLKDEKVDFDEALFKEFEKIFVSTIRNKYNLEAELSYPKENEDFVKKWTAKVFLPISHRKAKINIEICDVPSYDNKVMNVINHYSLKNNDDLIIRVESLEEILADKILALGCRKYIKYRDIWDIKWLLDKNTSINLEWINNKISDYHASNFPMKLAQKLEELQENKEAHNNGFINEMSRFVKPVLFEKYKKLDFFAETIDEVLENGENILELLKEQEYTKYLRKR